MFAGYLPGDVNVDDGKPLSQDRALTAPEDLLTSVLRLNLELAAAGWPQKWLLYAMNKALESEHVMNDALRAIYVVMQSALGL